MYQIIQKPPKLPSMLSFPERCWMLPDISCRLLQEPPSQFFFFQVYYSFTVYYCLQSSRFFFTIFYKAVEMAGDFGAGYSGGLRDGFPAAAQEGRRKYRKVLSPRAEGPLVCGSCLGSLSDRRFP